MKVQAVRKFLADAQAFFADYHDFLEFRISGLAKNAQGDSRYVSQWIAMVGQENVQAVIKKLDKYDGMLPWNLTAMFFDAVDMVGDKIHFTAIKQSAYQNAKVEKACKEVVMKVTAHLQRAQELLQEIDFNSSSSHVFIPVPGHKELAERSAVILQQCNKVLSDHLALSDQVVPKMPKSWLNDSLRMGSYLVAARLAAHGLPAPESKAPTMDNAAAAQKKLTEVHAKAKAVVETKGATTRLTRASRKILGAEQTTDLPKKSSLHFQYCPEDMIKPMKDFVQLMGRTTKVDTLTQKQVLDTVKTEFPTPARKYR